MGYSEPEAGSDLAALRTRAVRDGDDWVVNGQKLWSTGGDKAEYMWLAVRTDPDAKKHAGISVLMVDLRSPGVTIRPSLALYGKTFSAQFYDNVRVPAKNMVGAVNNGWKVITDALAAERVMIGGTRMAGIERAFDHLTEYLKTAVVGGKALKNDPVIRDRIGALAADIEVARQFQMRNSRLVEQGRVPIHEAAMGKVFASELQERLGQAALDILGTGGLLSEDCRERPGRRDGTGAAPCHHGHDRRRHQRDPEKHHRAAGAGFAPLNQELFMSEEQVVTYELEGEIALVGLNRPDKRNCFNPNVMKALREAIERAGEEAKCGIIFGHGDNFCAGLDLRWAAESWKTGRSERLPFQFNRNTLFRGDGARQHSLHRGAARRDAGRRAGDGRGRAYPRRGRNHVLRLPEGTRGIFIGGGGSVRVARLLGFARMQDMMLTGRVLKPDEAERYGIVQYVVPKGAVDGKGEGAGREKSARMRRCRISRSPTACRVSRTCPTTMACSSNAWWRSTPAAPNRSRGCTSSSTRPRRACACRTESAARNGTRPRRTERHRE